MRFKTNFVKVKVGKYNIIVEIKPDKNFGSNFYNLKLGRITGTIQDLW